MTFFHVLNFLIPISSIVVLGIVLDKISQPAPKKEEAKVVQLRK